MRFYNFFVLLSFVESLTWSSVAVEWTNAVDLSIGGRGFTNLTGNLTYTRLPPEAQADVTAGVWQYSRDSSGIFVQFFTDATSIHVNYTLFSGNLSLFQNFPPTGFSGCDLERYDESSNEWRYIGTTFVGLENFPSKGYVLDSPLWADGSSWPQPSPPANATGPTYRYRLNLPSYNGVTELFIGVPTGATLTPDDSWKSSKRILYIGTSITQGGITARPGQKYTSILSRMLNVEVVNMGFCGSCQLDLGMTYWVSQVPADLIVVDCAWNMSPEQIRSNTQASLLELRLANAIAPIVLVEPSDYRPSWIIPDPFNNTGRRIELQNVYNSLLSSYFPNLYYVQGQSLFAASKEDPTYEGTHPLDYGHELIAHTLAPTLISLLESQSSVKATPVPIEVESLGASPVSVSTQDTIVYTPATSLTIRGRGFDITQLPSPFNRLPRAAQAVVRPEVWSLSLNSAGLMVCFSTDSPVIYVNFSEASNFEPIAHFSATGMSGVDLFAWDETTSSYQNVAPVTIDYGTNSYSGLVATIANASPGKMTNFIFYLSTYNSVTSFEVGVSSTSSITPNEPYTPRNPPIVWYGTSILQGGVSFKPSRIFTSLISRNISREIFNFGFSGNGKMELSVAQYLVNATNTPALFIIDCLHNMDPGTITSNTIPLVSFIRTIYPGIKIVLVEATPFGRDWSSQISAEFEAQKNLALYEQYSLLQQQGVQNIFYVYSHQLYESTLEEDQSPTANCLHPSDAGMQAIADFWINFLPSVL
jgi:GDSL-like Lipase/Acylhydrolase family/N-terminus of Esterase_SGNH_hydro-type